jgi:hypothetical protein
MQMAAPKSRLGQVADAVKSAAQTTVRAASEYVIAPVGQALGLVTEEQPRSKSARKAARKAAVARARAKPARRTARAPTE